MSRLADAWRVLRGEPTPNPSPSGTVGTGLKGGEKEGKGAATVVASWQNNRPVYPDVSFESLVNYGYRKNELIYACVAKTAKTAAQVSLATGDERLKKLIQRPNPYMSEYDLWSAVIIYQKLAGRAAFEKVRSRSGQVVELWPLRPDWLKPIASSTKFISGYEYSPPGVDTIRLGTEDVLDFKLFDPLSQYNGWPPAAVAARVGDVDNSVTDFVKLFFEKGGVPMGLLKSKQRLMDTQVADIRRRWRERYGGFEKWIEPAVLDSDAEWLRTGLTFEEMGFEVLDARDEARICAVMDVPAIIVGAKIGLDRSTYANYREARLTWWEDSIRPVYEDFLDVLQNQLLPEFRGTEAEWDFSGVSAFQEEMGKIWQRSVDALTAGGITVNEFRSQIGLETVPSGNVFLRGSMQVERGVNEATGTGETDVIEEEDYGEEDEKHLHPSPNLTPDPFPKGKGGKMSDEERGRQEREIKRAMVKYWEGQRERVMKDAGT